MQIIYLLTGLVAGAAIALLYLTSRFSSGKKDTEARLIEADRQNSIINERLEQTVHQLRSTEESLNIERDKSVKLHAELAGERMVSENFREKLENQKREIENINERLKTEFENLSSKILEEKSKKFTEQNRTNLDVILTPLRDKIKEFEQKVEQSYKIESAERNSLKGEIKSLVDLNKQLSEDAHNLTRALKGDTKKQGNWGEVILARILERSGLTKGSEYEVQVSTSNDEGQRIQPDVILYLPDNKNIIIDAKVSLVAYEAMANATTEEDREKFLKEHINSVRSHIRLLGEKNYYSSQSLNTPDFVLIFMPIEPSFAVAVQSDAELFNYAWDRKIVLVSPTTLLATLKTVNAIWKQEKQTRNALEIAKAGGALYDKFFNFLKDMNNIGDKIRSAQQSHEEAMNKLSIGNGNILKRVEELKKLGAKSTKDIPQDLLERAEENNAGANF